MRQAQQIQDVFGQIKSILRASGCAAFSFIKPRLVPPQVEEQYRQWVKKGYNAGMSYAERHIPLRRHADHVLEGVKTIITIAFRFPYVPQTGVASYALGRDYHKSLRSRLKPVASYIKELGGRARICVDSAPLPERYYAVAGGIATRGRSGMVLVPGCGPFAFLCEILTDIELAPGTPWFAVEEPNPCSGCAECLKACPTGALHSNGEVDCRRCLSYLSIEHHGELPEDIGGGDFPLSGCEKCLSVCPAARRASAPVIPDLQPRPEIIALTPEKVLAMTDDRLLQLTEGTALRRPGIENLRRNARMAVSNRTKGGIERF